MDEPKAEKLTLWIKHLYYSCWTHGCRGTQHPFLYIVFVHNGFIVHTVIRIVDQTIIREEIENIFLQIYPAYTLAIDYSFAAIYRYHDSTDLDKCHVSSNEHFELDVLWVLK